jgi:hypothetical protein
MLPEFVHHAHELEDVFIRADKLALEPPNLLAQSLYLGQQVLLLNILHLLRQRVHLVGHAAQNNVMVVLKALSLALRNVVHA